MTTLFAFLHHLAAFALVAALAVELVLVRQELTVGTARRIVIVDAVLGASATLLLTVGLLRVFLFEKGAAYYFSNHAFLGKLTLFILLGALSVIPTLEFLSWRKALARGEMPNVEPAKIKRVRMVIHAELGGIVLILLFAAMMAR